MRHFFRHITERYLFRLLTSLVLAGVVVLVDQSFFSLVAVEHLLAMETLSDAYAEDTVPA